MSETPNINVFRVPEELQDSSLVGSESLDDALRQLAAAVDTAACARAGHELLGNVPGLERHDFTKTLLTDVANILVGLAAHVRAAQEASHG